jgi:hypothetical protein
MIRVDMAEPLLPGDQPNQVLDNHVELVYINVYYVDTNSNTKVRLGTTYYG